MDMYHSMEARWRNGYSVRLAISRLRVQILLGATLRNNLGQVVHTDTGQGGDDDALQLGR